MANEKRLIDAEELAETYCDIDAKFNGEPWILDDILKLLDDAPTVDAVEVQDKQLLNAIKLLIEQYEHSKKSDYVHSPVAHAFYHTWKQLDAKMDGDGNGIQ